MNYDKEVLRLKEKIALLEIDKKEKELRALKHSLRNIQDKLKN